MVVFHLPICPQPTPLMFRDRKRSAFFKPPFQSQP